MTHQDRILARLAAHKPLVDPVATGKLWLRWTTTAGMALLLPLGVLLARRQNPFLEPSAWWVALAVSAVGGLGVFIAWLAVTRTQQAEQQFGLAVLTPAECIELHELSSCDPRVQAIVDHWLDVWVSTGHSPRGRDLALVRACVGAWEVPAEPSSSIEGRHAHR